MAMADRWGMALHFVLQPESLVSWQLQGADDDPAQIEFVDVTQAAGLKGMSGGPAAWGDYDNDGWLKVRLQGGGQVNRAAIGAQVRIQLGDRTLTISVDRSENTPEQDSSPRRQRLEDKRIETSRTSHHPGSVPHSLQLFHDRIDASGTDQQDAIRQTTDYVIRQLLARQQFLGEHAVFRLDEAYLAMQFHGQARPG